MKKKLIQILMLLVAAVSVGSFVSCKDTNEDLYNELRAETIDGKATLEQALNQRVKDLQDQIDALKKLACTCDEAKMWTQINKNTTDIAGLDTQVGKNKDDIAGLDTQVGKNKNDIEALTKKLDDELKAITDLLNGFAKAGDLTDFVKKGDLDKIELTLTNLINGVKTDLDILKGQDLLTKITALNTAQDGLKDRIAALEKLINEPSDNNLFQRLSKIEQALADALIWKADILDQLNTAKETADNAKTLAGTASNNATQALELAKELQGKVDALTSNDDAAKALQLAQDAWNLADKALSAANTANDIAGQALQLAQTNEKDIKDLKDKADELNKLITDNKNELLEKIGKNAEDIIDHAGKIAKNAENIEKNQKAIEKLQEDVKTELKTINTNLTLATETANKAFQKAVDAANAADANHKLIDGLKTSVTTNTETIKNIKETVDKLGEAVDGFKTTVATNTDKIKNLEDAVKDVKENIKDLYTKYSELKTQLGELDKALTEAKAQCDKNLLEVKSHVDTEIANIKAAVTKQIADELEKYYDKDAIDAKLKNCVTPAEMAEKVAELYKAINDGDQATGKELYDLAQRVSANETAIWYINEALKYLSGRFSEFVPRPELEAWFDRIKALEGKTDGMKDQLKDELTTIINNGLKDIKDQLPDQIKDIINNNTTNLVDKDDVEKIVNDILNDRLTKEGFLDGVADLTELRARVKALEEGTVKIADYKVDKSALWESIKKLWGSVNANHNKIEDLKKSVNTINGKLSVMQSNISDLQTRMTTAENKLNNIVPAVQALQQNVEKIQSFLGQQITGITIQGVENPLFGSFSIPANIQTNVLVSYYGISTKPVKFPATSSTRYIRKEEALTTGDWAMIGTVKNQINEKAPVLLMNENEDGKAVAGKVYVTVNPTSIDATKLEPMKIVNSQDKESLIKLSKFRRSFETLQFGSTRADNGFYEADAYVDVTDPEIVNATLEFEETDLQNILDDARKQLGDMLTTFFKDTGATGHLDKVATDIYQIFKNLKLDQQGLKCPFKAPDNTTEQAVYSQYNMAATVIKPLTLNSLKALETWETVPGFEAARDELLKDIAGSLKGIVSGYFKAFDGSWKVGTLGTLSFDGVKLLGDANALINKFMIRVSSFTMDGNGYYFDIPAGGSAYVRFGNLTYGGSAVNVPDEVKFDINKAAGTTLVIEGALDGEMKNKLYIPAIGQDDVVAAYASAELKNVTVQLNAGVLEVYCDGTKRGDVAKLTGSDLTVTGYAGKVALDNLTGTKGSVEIPVVTEVSNDLKNLINGQENVLETITKLTIELDSFLQKIKNYEGIIGSDIDNFLNQYLYKYLEKINHTTTYFFNSINRRFGPFMVASNDGKGFKIMSTSKVNPTWMSAKDLKFYVTTKNLELLVPIARKHVAVTNVYNEDLTKNAQNNPEAGYLKVALDKVNAGEKWNEVIDGTERVIKADGLMIPGFIYEIAYSVLDFDGNISTRKCYVTVTK